MPIPDQDIHDNFRGITDRFWRYMSLDHLASLFRTEELLFRRVSEYPDPFEGAVPEAYVEQREESYSDNDDFSEDFIDVLSALNKGIVESTYANCWHRNHRESAAMWQSYGKKGIAITTNIESIFSAVEVEERTILIREVSYFDYYEPYSKLPHKQQMSLNKLLNQAQEKLYPPVTMKRKSFEHENEYRLLYPDIKLLSEEEYREIDANIVLNDQKWKEPFFCHWEGENGALDFRDIPEGSTRKIDVDLDCLINEIRIAPNSDDWFKKTVEELVDSMGPDSITSERVRISDTDLNKREF